MEEVRPLNMQTLEDVMFFLANCEDPRAKKVVELAKAKSIYSYNEDLLKALRGKKGQVGIFPATAWDAPVLMDFSYYPFTYLPTVPETRETLTSDLKNGVAFSFKPSYNSLEKDGQAALRLLDNLENMFFNERGSITGIKSPAFEGLRKEKMNWTSYGQLGQSQMRMVVAPSNEVFELQYRPSYFISSLVTGCKVWLVFPPHHLNIFQIVKEEEKQQGGNNFRSIFLNTVGALKHGLAIIQGPGETIRIPPFWIFMTITTQVSVCSGYFISTAETILERLFNAHAFLATARMWPSKEKEQSEIANLAIALGADLAKVLDNKIPGYRADRVNRKICEEWEGASGVKLKEHIPNFLGAIENKETLDKVTNIFLEGWFEFLDKRRRQKPECAICHMRLDQMDGARNGFKGQAIRNHFMAMHWGLDNKQ